MKKNSIFLLMIFVFALISCGDKKEIGQPTEEGKSQISINGIPVNIDFNADFGTASKATKATTALDITVRILNQRTNETIKEWKLNELPGNIELGVSSYKLEAFNLKTPQSGAWDQPAYYGSSEFEIEDGKTTSIPDLICRAINMKISVVYKPEFVSKMESYSTVITVGSKQMTFAANETRSAYFNPGDIIVYIVGKAKDGSNLQKTFKITGGKAKDNHIINVDATLTGNGIPSIRVDVTTNDVPTDLVVNDDDVIIDPNPTPEPEPEPEPEVKIPTIQGVGFDLSTPVQHQAATEKEIDIKITAEEGGIQALQITIVSPTLEPILASVGLPSKFDLANLPQDLKATFETLGIVKPGEVIKGLKEYIFSIKPFTSLLPAGEHKFKVKVTDAKNGSAEGTLTINVTE